MIVARNPLEAMARLGFGARGLVYCLVGGLALLAAIGSGGQTGGSRSALRTLLDEPFGRVMLGLIALGLAAFAVWRVLESVTDADRLGTSWKGLGRRAGHFVGGVIHASLGLFALGLALGWGGGGGEDAAARDWTAWLMAMPLGQWLVGLAGLVVVGAGLAFIGRAWRADVTDHLACDAATARWAIPAGRIGFAARGVVFLIIGGFVILAAIRSNSGAVKGLGGALESLQAQPYGWVLLGLTAAGLFAFGVFGFVQALYRHIDPPDADDARAALADGARLLKP